MAYYIIYNNTEIFTAERASALTNFYPGYEVHELPADYNSEKYQVVDGQLVLNPNYDAEQLARAKQAKYDEANNGAVAYLEGGGALFPFVQDENIYHIEATDGNIAKIGLKATALLIAQDLETTFPWNTKEDINIQINALEGKAIAEGLGTIQDEVWTIKFPHYVALINAAETVEEVNAIEIDYSAEIEVEE